MPRQECRLDLGVDERLFEFWPATSVMLVESVGKWTVLCAGLLEGNEVGDVVIAEGRCEQVRFGSSTPERSRSTPVERHKPA